MAFSKTLGRRFIAVAKARSPPARSTHPSSLLRRVLPDSGEEQGILQRLLQRRPLFQVAIPPDRIPMPRGDQLIERIRRMNADRIRLDVLVPPVSESSSKPEAQRISVEEVRKVLKASLMEAVRSRLRASTKSCVSYSEFLQICCEASSNEQGLGIANSLDDSGAVIVFGNVVFLCPDQMAKMIERMFPLSLAPKNDTRRDELREMEARKSLIDRRAEIEVKRELWCGLGIAVLQTAGLLRLTFWELSWDVMEPVCFFLTSFYFMAGYAFFLRTWRDPSFEGFFESRFATKQGRLMRAANFDLDRFNELQRACPGLDKALDRLAYSSPYCDCRQKETVLGVGN